MNSAVGPVSPLVPDALVAVERTFPVDDIVAGWRSRFGVDVTSEFGGLVELKLCRCTRSRLGFFWPLVAGSSQLYAQLESRPWYYRRGQWEYGYAIGRTPVGSRVLDLGCGSGGFVEEAGTAGLAAEGLDFNPAAVVRAQARGLKVTCGDWGRVADEKQGSYDMVTAFQLLEHLADPLGFLQSAVRLIRRGGRLLLAVPDGGGWFARSGNLLDMPPHHVLRWNACAMRFLTTCLPLELEELRVEPLDPLNARDFVGSWVHPNCPVGDRPALPRRALARALTPLVALPLVRRRLPGQCLIAVFRRVGDLA